MYGTNATRTRMMRGGAARERGGDKRGGDNIVPARCSSAPSVHFYQPGFRKCMGKPEISGTDGARPRQRGGEGTGQQGGKGGRNARQPHTPPHKQRCTRDIKHPRGAVGHWATTTPVQPCGTRPHPAPRLGIAPSVEGRAFDARSHSELANRPFTTNG